MSARQQDPVLPRPEPTAVGARVSLTIAGSDPSGGAGIQADLKTFSVVGAYGTAVLTALTAQNTHGVQGVHLVPASFVADQLTTLLDDVTVHATKTGMLPTADIVTTVARALAGGAAGPVVVDPVLVATSGDQLVDDDAVRAIREELFPVAALVTPNVPEAARMLHVEPARSEADLRAQAVALLDLGPGAVLVKGGHLAAELGESVDVLAVREPGGGAVVHLSRRPVVHTVNTHGTGCMLSAALAGLATVPSTAGEPPRWPGLVEDARDLLQAGLLAADDLRVGSGNGPVHHLARMW